MVHDQLKSDTLQNVPVSQHSLHPSKHLNLLDWVVLLGGVEFSWIKGSNICIFLLFPLTKKTSHASRTTICHHPNLWCIWPIFKRDVIMVSHSLNKHQNVFKGPLFCEFSMKGDCIPNETMEHTHWDSNIQNVFC